MVSNEDETKMYDNFFFSATPVTVGTGMQFFFTKMADFWRSYFVKTKNVTSFALHPLHRTKLRLLIFFENYYNNALD